MKDCMNESRIAEELDALFQRLDAMRGEVQSAYWHLRGEEDFLGALTGRQLALLRLIAAVAPCPLARVVERSGLTKGSASVAVRKLARSQVLEIRRSEVDRRELVIDLAPAARRHLEGIDRAFQARLRASWAHCDELILDELLEQLQMLKRQLEE